MLTIPVPSLCVELSVLVGRVDVNVGRVDVDVEVDMEVEWVDVVGVNGSGLWLSGFAFFGTEGFFFPFFAEAPESNSYLAFMDCQE